MSKLNVCEHGIIVGSIHPCTKCAQGMWYIRNIKNNSAWDNQWGWMDGEEDTFTLFTEFEKEVFNLPIDGEWVQLD